ncbi:MAG: tetratricopeptide repeat protein, partial [Natronosporangium sp.]
MALAELGRVDEAAGQAEQILRRGRGNGYACTSAAAILAEVRVGQVALDAAWEGVRLAPEQPRSHLVLGVVASRLGLNEIASRAYQEALGLDPQLAVAEPAPAALGMARAEQHRYVAALSHLRRAKPVPSGGAGPSSPVAGRGAEPEAGSPVPGELHRLVRYGVGYAIVAPLLVAAAYLVGSVAPAVSALLAGAGLAGGLMAWQRVPEEHRADLPELMRADRVLAVAVCAVLAAPVLLLLFALVDAPGLLVAAMAAGAVAGLASRRRPII